MMDSPLIARPIFHVGQIPVTEPVVMTWLLMAALTAVAAVISRRLRLNAGRWQAVLELLVTTLAGQIRETMRTEPARFIPLIATLLIFITAANLMSLIPGLSPPTGHLETAGALALVVFCAVHVYGVRALGAWAYLKTFAAPSWVLLPLNLLAEITRTFSLMVRLAGNIMSGVFVVGIVLSLAGLFVPIPLMALDLLTGIVQGYIFTVLAMIFIGAAIHTTDKS